MVAPRAAPTASDSEESTHSASKILSPEEAIQAEEVALKALEATIIPLRQAAQTLQPRSLTPPTHKSPSPVKSQAIPSQTPAKTPIPYVTNALVNTATPRRLTQRTVDRFSPLRLLTTPRVRKVSSGLRYSTRDEEVIQDAPIPAAEEVEVEGEDEESVPDAVDEDQTIRIVHPQSDNSDEDLQAAPQVVAQNLSPLENPQDPEPIQTGPRTVHGVPVDREEVTSGIVSEH